MTKLSLAQRRARLVGPHDILFYDNPIELVRGEGVRLYDVNGREYLDCYNNVPCVGHCHPKVVEALTRQAKTLNTHSRYLDENMVSYCEQLLAKFDGEFDRTVLTCTGSEANDLALRLARHHSGGEGIICTNGTYHGNTTAVSQLTSFYTPVGGAAAQVSQVAWPDTYRVPDATAAENPADYYANAVKAAIDDMAERGIKPAALIVCPLFANEGLPNVPKGYLEKAVNYVREAGGLFIADEVQAGFGRGGKWWGYQHYDLTPDIITLGKPMGAGHPLAGLVTRCEIIDAYRQQEMYFNTFAGNPVSSAVGLAVLQVLEEEGLVDNAREVGRYLLDGFNTLQSRFDMIGDVRGKGLFFGLDIVKDRASKIPDVKTAARLVNAMREQGVLLSKAGAANNVLKIRPPLCFSKNHADQLLATLDLVFSKGLT